MKDALAQVDDKQLDRLQAIIRGMTPAERADPKIINGSRRLRIANGSGVTVSEVNDLVNRFFEARKMMKQMAGPVRLRRRRSATSKQAKSRKGKKGKAKGRGPTPPRAGLPAGFGGGMPDLSGLPPSLRELPPGLDQLPPGFDPSKLQVPEGTSERCTGCAGCCCPARRPSSCSSTPPAGSAEPIPGAETLVDGGFIVPGLVDAHCHVGLGLRRRPVDLDEADAQARTDRDAGTLLIRDCGSPVDTSPLQARADLPEIIRAGRHLARPKRYIPGLAVELDDPALLPEAVAEQAAAGDGWVKLVGDWIDRGVGDLAPLWPDDVLVAAIDAAHARRRPGHRARVRHRRAARPDPRRHRLHRARHRPDRRPHRRDGRARHRAGPHADQRRDVPGDRRPGRASTRPTPRTCGSCTPARATWCAAPSRPGCRCTRAPTPAAASRTAASSTR